MKLGRVSVGIATTALLLIGMAALAPVTAQEDRDKAGDEQAAPVAELPRCPVMGEAVSFSVSVRTDEGPVFFCCARCSGKYARQPEKYTDEVAKQRAALAKREKIQVSCPVSGEAVDEKVFTEKDGQKVYFCCPKCRVPYESDPGKYKAGLANSYTYQTRCPVSGERISPASRDTLPTGETVYYCCSKCPAKFRAEPGKYAANLARQGIPVDLEALEKALKE
jgi:YHS domain-containing protein